MQLIVLAMTLIGAEATVTGRTIVRNHRDGFPYKCAYKYTHTTQE